MDYEGFVEKEMKDAGTVRQVINAAVEGASEHAVEIGRQAVAAANKAIGPDREQEATVLEGSVVAMDVPSPATAADIARDEPSMQKAMEADGPDFI